MTLLRGGTLVAAAITLGLSAGLFYTYSASVMLGLGRSDDRTFVQAMQNINVAIINPWFMAHFMGALVLTALAAALHLPKDGRAVLPWILLALALYLVAIVVTGTQNVPMNNALAAAGTDTPAALAAAREAFEGPWVRWNIVRTVASTGSLGAIVWALVRFGQTST
ncbi:DUF1772 domain-containing protein [Virgisporangium ochraceum]|uniref:Membrane protein n=1 Tax=Virgisporangium ochraceum TaxID=65505 RepID=A0A8J4E7T5_9ACTN|nr:anthrone oxygenase family protein [Virgisporangium ochraceum]GIJ65455.1 membrane protein [Virgisporangium ochraceum]